MDWIVALLHVCGDWDNLKEVAADTFTQFSLLAADTKVVAALSLWNDAVKASANEKLLEEFETVRQIIAAGVFKHLTPGSPETRTESPQQSHQL